MKDFDWLFSGPIAHRGLFGPEAGVPENSLTAFRLAAERGIPFELDVQLSRDGTLVVAHDATLARMAGCPKRISELGREELSRLRLGESDEPVPTLQQVWEITDGRVPVIVDVRRWGIESSPLLERAVAGSMRDYPGPVAVQSFDPLAVHRLRRLVSDRPVGQVSGALRSAGRVTALIGSTMAANALTSPDFISYELDMLPSRYATFWHRRGIPLLAWTVSSSESEARAAQVADNFFFDGYLPTAYRHSAEPPARQR
ncbi:glycerophosphodiester phosphodiesterase family protein [Streptomyces inhibens]|uniref:glycerophosphodiester phosphodiesterase family protein n=1 Tax=Streptomyces inhibens TaxID=2293571 RepID=UPI003681641B